MTTITGILLAAGQSSRFGTNKLLHPLDNNKTIAQQAAETLKRVCPNSIIVLNSNAPLLIESLDNSGLKIIKNMQADNGMGNSIACAVMTIESVDACIIALADMPYLKPETIKLIIEQAQDNKCIVAPTYRGQQGHPVLFTRHFYHELTQLNNDRGARDIIDKNLEFLTQIEIDDVGIIRDIDVPDDLIF